MFENIVQMIGEQAMAAAIAATISSLATLLLSLLMFKRPDLRDELQVSADYSEAFEAAAKIVAVHAAEKMGIRFEKFGLDKMNFALDVYQAALASAGIRGNASNVDFPRVVRDMKALVAQLFPKAEPHSADKPAA